MAWKTADQRKIDARRKKAHEEIFFYGTPENDYQDSGLWRFLTYVKTFDEHDELEPYKYLINKAGQLPAHLEVLFYTFLSRPFCAIPKSRQMQVSWAIAVFCCWYARTAAHRAIVIQSKAEIDANKLVTLGREMPLQGRMSFIEHNLPKKWLACPNIVSGNGNRCGSLVYWNQSNVTALPLGGHKVRSLVPTLYVGDEAAFLDDFDEAYSAAIPSAKRIILCSSPWPGQFKDFLFRDIREDHGGVKLANGSTIQLPGLRSWTNRYGVYCLEVRYNSDPSKDPERDGRNWYEVESEKAGGPLSAKWRRERECDWEIMGSEPVFPFAADENWPGYIPRLEIDDVRDNMKIVAGFDYAPRSPSAFIVWAADKYGNQYAVWEIYEPCMDVPAMCQKIKDCPYFDKISEMRADPEIWRLNQQKKSGGLCTVADQFAENGVHFQPGRRQADVPVAVRFTGTYWKDPKAPTAFITNACPNMKREIKLLHWEEPKTAYQMANKEAPQTIVQKDNHAWDATAYIMDTRPREAEVERTSRGRWTVEYLMDEIDRQDRNRRVGYVNV